MGHGEGPGHHASPIVPDDHGLAGSEVVHHRNHVTDQLGGCVVLDALGLTARVVAALIDRHDMEVLRKLGHLGSPGIPEVGETVDHDDQGIFLAAQADIVDFDPA